MSKSIKIRMYNVGFGDCFLLEFPKGRTMLVDAGFHSQGKGEFGGNDLVEQIVDDLQAISGKARIDVVVATHRHQDHVYAFNSKSWGEVEIGEVWLPWVEDRDNKKAAQLWKKQKSFALQLQAALPTFGLSPSDQHSVNFMLWNAGIDVPEFGAAGGWSNKGALDTLHTGFKRRDSPKPRFLPATESFPEGFTSDALPDVRVYVLGPPRDPDLIQELDPEADGETYRALALRGAAVGLDGGAGGLVPFDGSWYMPDGRTGILKSEERERINDLARSADALLAAEKVDDMINSTSLVLVIEFGKARMLLPGDAEWGTWKRILQNSDARALLHGATFLKVGHHGSHNATAKTLVEEVLPTNIPAMVSTQEGDGNYRNNIPLGDLMTALEEHGIRYVRSDKPSAKLPKNFAKGPDNKWVDLKLPC